METELTLAQLEAIYAGQLEHLARVNEAIARVELLKQEKAALEGVLKDNLAKLSSMYEDQKLALAKQLEEVTT